MRTLTIYKYSELPEEAKAKAIEEVREEVKEYEQHSAFQWAIDDCSLFEPQHAEMAALFGDDYYDRNLTADGKYGQFVFKNNRKGIEFDDYFETVQITDALEITNLKMFKTWLGIPEIFHDIYIGIMDWNGRTIIEIENPFPTDDPRHEAVKAISDNAAEKFDAHMSHIAQRIVSGTEEYFSDENIEAKIEEGDFEFDGEGGILKVANLYLI